MDENVSFTPVNFFQFSIDCHQLSKPSKTAFSLNSKNYTSYLLPNVEALVGEEYFGEVALGWGKQGVEIFALIKQPFLKACYPQYEKGDSLELCLDTRDVKSSGYNTPYCHHFVFLPESVEGLQAQELTKFRTEDRHELCNPQELVLQTILKADHYILQALIPAHCLYGYDPEQFDRLGMTYRINRLNGPSQHFSVKAADYKFQEQPSLWASLRLIA